MTKYVCLKEGCDFISENESEARRHIEDHANHKVIEVSMVDDTTICNPLGDTGEELSEEELPEAEEMSEAEERE